MYGVDALGDRSVPCSPRERTTLRAADRRCDTKRVTHQPLLCRLRKLVHRIGPRRQLPPRLRFINTYRRLDEHTQSPNRGPGQEISRATLLLTWNYRDARASG